MPIIFDASLQFFGQKSRTICTTLFIVVLIERFESLQAFSK